MKNLSPTITRKRLIIEGKTKDIITDKKIKDYLSKLSTTLNMKTLSKPTTHLSKKFGWAGWIHWEKSGCHFYAWNKPFPFFSADIYTCSNFNIDKATKFTKKYFNTIEIEFKEVKI